MLNIIVNPTAGGKHGRKTAKALKKVQNHLNERKVDYTIHPSKYRGHATILTKELIEKGATDIVIMGGDGSLHEVINGFSNFENVNLGLIPCGTGNDFANALHLPLDPVKALDIIIDGNPQYTDFLQLPTVRGMNVVGVGIDVDVLVRYSKLKRKNKFGYTWCLIKTLLNFEYSSFTAEVDGESKDYTAFIAALANGHAYGGGIRICPPALPTDKKLDFLVVNQIPKHKILFKLIQLLGGKIMKFPETEHKTCKKVKITPKGDYTVNVDGELYPNIPFEVEVISDTLKMYR